MVSNDQHSFNHHLVPGGLRRVLFDLDAVLTQTASVHAAAWKRLFDGFLQQRSASTGEAFIAFDIDFDHRRATPRQTALR